MKKLALALLLSSTAPLLAEETRQLGAHEHGVGSLNIAIEADEVVIELVSPGADITGFEYAAESDEDKALVAAALEKLDDPLALFTLPEAAHCHLHHAHVEIEYEGADAHEGHDHDEHDHDEHKDHDHDEHAHDDHGHDDHHDEHKEEAHDAHDHDEHAHDDHGHDDHAEEAGGHNEFHAEYELDCDDTGAIDTVDLAAYFAAFENAGKLDVQVVTEAGATGVEATKDSPTVTISAN